MLHTDTETPEQLRMLPGADPQTRASRSDALYGTHAYHTKVPPSVAASYIERHCPPGGTVIDPFCGSGMTGVGALMMGRNARLSDLSPAAVHIAANYTTPCDARAFDQAVGRVLDLVGSEIEELYLSSVDGAAAVVEHVVWSDVRVCPQCGHAVVLWERRAAGLRRLECEQCGHAGAKSSFRYVGERPVETSLSQVAGRRRVVRPAKPADTRQDVEVPAGRWYPTDRFDASRPMWRRSHAEMGITSVDRFFSARNLAALAALWEAASAEQNERLRSALRFSLTAIINRASRRYQWNAKRPTNVLGGTLYVSSLRYEWNVLSLWRRKVAAVRKLFSQRPPTAATVSVARESAISLGIEDASIDYCFCDPPFGAHIVYSDASLLWEAWLGQLTERDREAIVVRAGNELKTVGDYRDVLSASFAEVRRVLVPGGKATVIFQATDSEVWKAIIAAAGSAGLEVVEATTLNKGQPSFKQIKGTNEGERVAHSDVVLTFATGAGSRSPISEVDVRAVVRDEIRAAADDGRNANHGHIYAVVAAALLATGGAPLSYDEVGNLMKDSRRGSLAVR